ncbi:MAG: type II secretion system protein [Planctomycetes bacterium]|nr:type II secretion system protein [Planctomycetota bacterium]
MRKRLAMSYKLLAGSGGRLPRRSDSPLILHPSSFRRAFSLLELMIAIVILGIGMVMVATIFPIGIDLAAQTVQMNIAQAVADAAMPTLELKVPIYSKFGTMSNPNVHSPVVIAADVMTTDMDIPVPTIDEVDKVALSSSGLSTGAQWNPPVGAPWFVDTSLDLDMDSRTIASHAGYLFNNPPELPKLRYFTETTGWTGEKSPPSPGEQWDYAHVIPSQNLWPAYMNPPLPYVPDDVRGLPPMIPPTLGQVPDVYPLNLVDCVYPPVPWALQHPSSYQMVPLPLAGVLSDLAGRRYSWIAIHHYTDPNVGGSRFVVTLLVTHRSNLVNRYARQADMNSTPGYNPSFSSDAERRKLEAPKPDDDPSTDMLFPQPWLVRFRQINPGTGEVRCEPEVARLLPAGSYFVIARSVYAYDAGNTKQYPPILTAGTACEVLGNQGGTLQIRRQGEPGWTIENPISQKAMQEVYAWVVPPAIERSGKTYTFQTKSPVAGVFMRMVQ